MKMKEKLLTTAFIMLVISFALGANRRQVRHYTVDEGLSSNTIYSIAQDSKGIMWFGTLDGLHSFNGSAVRAWRDGDKKHLGSTIYAIREDDKNRLWIGTELGVVLFDLRHERFSDFDASTSSGTRITSMVRDILHDSRGDTWIATYGQGIFRYDPKTERLVQYLDGKRQPAKSVLRLMEDNAGNIWTVSRENGISIYRLENDSFAPVPDTENIICLTIYEDRQSNIWVGAANGLYIWDRNARKLIRKLAPQEGDALLQIRAIRENFDGALALATDDKGLIMYNPVFNSICRFTTTDEASKRLSDDHLHAICVDREKALWVGSYFGGINYISPGVNKFENLNQSNSGLDARIAGVLAPGSDGKVWVGTDDAGFFLWDLADNTFRHYSTKSGTGVPSYDNVHALLQDGDRLYVGMYMGGLDILNLSDGTHRHYMPGEGPRSLYSQNIYDIHKDRRGDIFVATTKGLNRYVPETDDFEKIAETANADVEYIFEDSKGFLYALSLDRGLFYRDPANGKWRNVIKDGRDHSRTTTPAYSFVTGAEDSEHDIWLGTAANGLLKYDRKNDRFTKVEFPVDIRKIYKILPYKGQLWLTSSNGLYCYSPKTGQLKPYTKSEGLHDRSFRPNSGIVLPDGTFIVGTSNGISKFRPSDFSVRPVDPEVVLTDFRIFNKTVAPGAEDAPIDKSITYSDGLTLKSDHTNFSFCVNVMSYVNPGQNSFMYMLEGFDKDWNEPSSDNVVSYTNLPPGKYTFRVKTSNGVGGWNEDALSFPIEVLPPWWLSWPMIIVYILAVIAIAYFIWRAIQQNQKRKIEKLAIDKDKELYRSKIDFFTHMVHEIRTPLTLILSPLENIMKTSGDVKSAMPQLKVMERNGNRLLNLVNQLMDFRKVEAGNTNSEISDIDLRTHLANMYQNFIPFASQRKVKVEMELPEGDCMARGNSEGFSHIFDNIMSNAMKFARSRITIRLEDNGDGFFKVTIADDGAGIPKEEREKIFAPFYQIKDNQPSDYIGTGIGLMLVRKYVDLLGGKLELKSDVGLGSSFTVYLKKSASQTNTEELTSGNSAENAEENAATSENMKPRLLVVDDNADLRDFLKELLSPTYDVVCAENGRDALDRLGEGKYSLILSDVMMPEMDGFELCRRVKSNISTSHIPVILLTAKATTDDFVEGYEKGADAYVAKPFSADVIKAQVKAIIANRERLKKSFASDPSASMELVPNSQLDKELLDKVTGVIMRHLAEPEFGVDELARELGMSRTRLFTKIKEVSGMTPNAFMRTIRLRRAAELMAQNDARVNEVCYEIGFTSRSHFTKCFQEQFGMSPSDYRKLHKPL